MSLSSHDFEKGINVDRIETVHVEQDAVDSQGLLTPKEQRKTIHKIDLRLVVTLGVVYCINLMDRTNLSLAAVAGMNADLDLKVGHRYSVVVLIFFPTYVLFQPVATVLIRKIGPRRFLSAIALFWGAVVIGFGFVNNWVELVPLRILLGLFEAGTFPGSAYLLSCWYTRFELQRRNTLFFGIGMIAMAFSGILASGISKMDGIAEISGWRWIFILEGAATCVVALVAYWILIDFPDRQKSSKGFLTEKQMNFVVARLEEDRKDVTAEPFRLGQYLSYGKELKVWIWALMSLCITTNTYALAYFLPLILRNGMGFGQTDAQLLTAPPYVAAAILMGIEAYIGDKWKIRGLWMAINGVIAVIGLVLLGFTSNNALRYFGTFLATAGSNANIPASLAYISTNIRGQWKRAFVSGFTIGSSGIGGIVGSLTFRAQDAPGYRPGLVTVILANCIVVAMSGVLTLHFRRANARADRSGIVLEGLAGFRYTI